jgi:hypothetical protein
VEVALDGSVVLPDVTLPEPVRQLQQVLDSLTALSPSDLPDQVAVQVAATLLQVQDRVQGLALRSVADMHQRDLYVTAGAPSTGTWVEQQRTSMPRSHVALARKIERVPQVAVRVAAGQLTVDGAVVIGRALDRLRPHVDRPDGLVDGQPADQALGGVIVDGARQLIGEVYGGLGDRDPRVAGVISQLREIAAEPFPDITRLESAFLVVADHVPSRLLAKALAVLVHALLPHKLAESSDDAHLRRGLELIRDPEGSGWLLRGHLDDECGERLHEVLTAGMATDPENATDTAARQASADEEVEAVRPRSRSMRRHDALNRALGSLLGSGVLGSRVKVPMQIGVTISLDALHGLPGALPARTGSGAVVPADLVRRWLCDSAVTRFVLGLGNRVIEMSHTGRTAKPHERRIKHMETGGICQGAGCSRGGHTGDPLIPHHAVPYAVDPVTRLEDTVLLCPVTHDDIHVGGKTIRLKDGRLLNERGWVERLE